MGNTNSALVWFPCYFSSLDYFYLLRIFKPILCIFFIACMPPDNHSDFDLHLVQSVRSLRDLRKDLSAGITISSFVRL